MTTGSASGTVGSMRVKPDGRKTFVPELVPTPWNAVRWNAPPLRPTLTGRDVLQLIRERVKANDGNEAATARALGVSKQWLSLVLAGEREPGPKILAALKLRRVESFEPL